MNATSVTRAICTVLQRQVQKGIASTEGTSAFQFAFDEGPASTQGVRLLATISSPVALIVPAMAESAQFRGDSGSSAVNRKCQQDDDDDDGGTSSNSHNGINSSWNSLSEDVVYYIHALMPLRDASRAACVSRSFRCSWRHYPNLTFGMKELGLIGKAGTVDEGAMDLLSRIDHIVGNHSGIGVKTLELQLPWNWNRLDTYYVDRFLKTAIAPGIQELTVMLPSFRRCKTDYNFPCSLLSGESGRSIRYLKLTNSSFHPTAGLGCLTRLNLRSVRISDDELGCFLSGSLALRHLQLSSCDEIMVFTFSEISVKFTKIH